MSEKKSKGRESLNRPLTQHERDIVRWLLEHGETKHKDFLSQIDNLTVVSKCTCGCPTVDFASNAEPVAEQTGYLICDFLANVDAMEVGVLLFQNGGHLSTLEVYACAGSDKPFGLPEIEALFPWEELSKRRQKPSPA